MIFNRLTRMQLSASSYVFSRLFWLKAFSSHNVIAGFTEYGVYPFNRNAIEILDDDTANKSGIDLNCSHDDCTPMLEDFDPSDVYQYQPCDKMNEESAPSHSKTFCFFSKDLKRVMTCMTSDLAKYQTKSRDKFVNHSCQFLYSWLVWLVFLLFIYVIDTFFLFKFIILTLCSLATKHRSNSVITTTICSFFCSLYIYI